MTSTPRPHQIDRRSRRSIVRRVAALPLLLTTMLAPVTAAPASAATEVLTLVGRGNGHGIGLSQYGTQGQALDGRSAEQIIATYYKGATVAKRSVGFQPRIGVALDQFSVRFVVRGGTAKVTIDGVTETAAADSIWTMTVNGKGRCTTARHGGTSTVGGCPTFDPVSPARIEVRKGVTATSWSIHHQYGRSSVVEVIPDEIASGVWRMDVVVQLPLDQYLFGLAEMPYSWRAEALQAQAIAGRSYALWRMLDLGNDPAVLAARGCSCHLYDSQQDQVFKGWDRETTELWSAWKKAVQDTENEVVLASGAIGTQNGVVQAFYSSSSNGRTESKHELWGGKVYPYLVSVDDPWSLADFNPHRRWELEVETGVIAARVGIDEVDNMVVTARSTSGAATEVVIAGTDDGAEVEVHRTGTWVRQSLGLRSTTIDVLGNAPFNDVAGSVHVDSIAWLAGEGITKGCNPPDNTLFCPDDAVTRGQMAAFLVRALRLPAGPAAGFSDTDGHRFEQDIDALAAAGITSGCGHGQYCPDRTVTRGQMAAFLVRALELPEGPSGVFRDTVGDRFERDIDALREADVTRGCNPPTNDRYCPGNPVTRAQMASFLFRALG